MNDYSESGPHGHRESSSDRYIKALTLFLGALTFLASTIAIEQTQSSSEATAEIIQLLEEVVDNTDPGGSLTVPPATPSIVPI